MTYTWYFIVNKTEFLSLDLVSRSYDLFFDGITPATVLVTNGIALGILFDDVFLSLELNDSNPFEFDSHAIYIDESQNVWLGVLVES